MSVRAPIASATDCTPGIKTLGSKLRERVQACRWSALGALCLLAALLPAQAQEVFYIHTDALGSPVAETDANRNVVKRYEYEPYGRRLNGSNDDKPGYTGHVMDAATGLTYMQQRYYDPEIGVFLSVDPVTALGNGDMRHFNRYAYAFNNPYKFTDPDGRAAACLVPGIMQMCMAAAVKTIKVMGALGAGAYAGYKAGQYLNESADEAATPANADEAGDRIKGLIGENPTTDDVKGLADKGWEWRGKPGEAVGSDKGAFVNPETGEQIHNDLDSHESGSAKGPHVTYTDSSGKRWDHFPEQEQTVEQKK